jgi:hypothetical protein
MTLRSDDPNLGTHYHEHSKSHTQLGVPEAEYTFPVPEQNTTSHIIFNCISIAVTHSVLHPFMRVNKEHYYMSYKQR